MICPKCGREIPHGSICSCHTGSKMLSSNPAVNVIKNIGSSKMFLTIAILLVVSAALTVVNTFVSSSGVIDDVSNFFSYNFSTTSSLFESVLPNTIVSVVINFLPSAVIILAFWLHYITCNDVRDGGISTVGLTVYRVVQIVALVLFCIAVLSVTVLIVFMTVFMSSILSEYFPYSASNYINELGVGFISGMMIAILLFFIIASIFYILYSVKLIRMIARIKQTAITGVADARIPSYVIVMNYIVAGFTVLTGILSFRTPLSALGCFVSAAIMVLQSLCLSKYKKQMSDVMYMQAAPVGGSTSYANPYQPQQPQYPSVSQAPSQGAEVPNTANVVANPSFSGIPTPIDESAAAITKRFDVILINPGEAAIAVIKAIRAETGLGLKEAKELVDFAPKAVKVGISKVDAEILAAKLGAIGAQVALNESLNQ